MLMPVQGRVKSVKALVQAMSMDTPGAAHIDLGSESLNLNRGLRDKGDVDGLVLRAWPAGCTVSGGTINLPRCSVLLLTGRGVHFKGTSFCGGILVCCGGKFSATFQNCSFTLCTLYVVHGAAATLRRCALSKGLPAAVAHGAGTALHLHACTLEACMTDVTAERGATVTAVRCRSSSSVCSIIARDTGTAVSCHDCYFSGMYGAPAMVADHSRLLLRGCSIRQFEPGVLVTGRRAAVEMHACDVTAGQVPVKAHAGASVLLRQTQLLVWVSPRAVRPPLSSGASTCLACPLGPDRGGAAHLDRCTLSAPEPEHLGVALHSGAAATLLLCEVSSGGTGVSVLQGSRATVSHCSVQSLGRDACSVQGPGCTLCVNGGWVEGGVCAGSAMDEGHLIMRDAFAGGLPGAAAGFVILARLGGTVSLLRCSLQSAQVGVLMKDATVHATDVTVSGLVHHEKFQGEEGLCSTGFQSVGGTLSVVRGTLCGCTVAVCLADQHGNAPGSAHFEDVAFDGNGVGLRVHEGAGCAITVERCDFRGSASAAAAQRVLAGVQPHQMAVLATRCNTPVSVRDSVFRGHQRVVVVRGCAINVSGCTFLGSLGEGVHVLPAGSGSVRDSSFEGRVAEGVSVVEGARAKISGCRFDGCKHAIRALQDTTVSVVDTACTSVNVGLWLSGAAAVRAQRLTVTGCGEAVVAEAWSDQRTVVTLLDCVATGAQATAVALQGAGVEARMQGCTLKDSDLGLSVVYGASARVADTRIAGCKAAALVGEPEYTWESKCPSCGRSGAAAMARAWHALHAAGRGGVEGASCAHEGAVAAAILEDVVVFHCDVGLQVSGAGRVTARRLDVRGALTAYSLKRIAATHVFEDCVASGSTQSAVLSKRVLGPELGYRYEPEAVSGIAVRGGTPPPASDLKICADST